MLSERGKEKMRITDENGVLILIVMEDALRVEGDFDIKEIELSLNPYCNGRCSQRSRHY